MAWPSNLVYWVEIKALIFANDKNTKKLQISHVTFYTITTAIYIKKLSFSLLK